MMCFNNTVCTRIFKTRDLKRNFICLFIDNVDVPRVNPKIYRYALITYTHIEVPRWCTVKDGTHLVRLIINNYSGLAQRYSIIICILCILLQNVLGMYR